MSNLGEPEYPNPYPSTKIGRWWDNLDGDTKLMIQLSVPWILFFVFLIIMVS